MLFTTNAYADVLQDPCDSLLAMINRPTAGDSACVVPENDAILESGYQYQRLPFHQHQQNFPQAELRLGLPKRNELVMLLPNYIEQSIPPDHGYGPSTIGIKHEVIYRANYVVAVESLFTLPSGGNSFGTDQLGGAANGIISYNLTSQFNVTSMLGISNQSTSVYEGGHSYTSINPDLVLSWSPASNITFYIEGYGQSKTGPGEGNGFNADSGLVYLIDSDVALDLEVGQRINGLLGGFENYIGSGVSVKF